MQHVGVRRLFVACWLLSLWLAPWAFAAPARLTVQVDRPGPRISPTLYGIFFEEINLAGDGGLYAELVRNRSFEDAEKPDHWSLVSSGSMKGEMAIDAQQPMSPQNRHSLRLTITPGGEGRLGVANGGYFGIALQKGAAYQLTLAARAGEGFAGPLAATLEDQGGRRVYAQAKIEGVGGPWRTFQATLVANASDPKARLVIAAAQPGVLWLDMVSLFPKQTWKGRRTACGRTWPRCSPACGRRSCGFPAAAGSRAIICVSPSAGKPPSASFPSAARCGTSGSTRRPTASAFTNICNYART